MSTGEISGFKVISMIDISENTNVLGITPWNSINFLFTVVNRYIFKVKACKSILSRHSLIALVKKIYQVKNVPLLCLHTILEI